MQPQPGLLRELTGTDVRDFTFVSPAEDSDPDRPVFNDVLTPLEGTETLSTYKTSYYAGEASLTEKKLGRGRTIHLGSAFSRNTAEELFRYTGILEPFRGIAEAPADVQLVMREKNGVRYLFALNYMQEERSIILKRSVLSLYTGETLGGEFILPAYGTAVFQL